MTISTGEGRATHSPGNTRAALRRGALIGTVVVIVLAGAVAPALAASGAGAGNPLDESEYSSGSVHITGFDGEPGDRADDGGDLLPPTLAVGAIDPTSSFVLLAVYNKYNDVSPLSHDLRSDIMETVVAAPGIYLGQLVRRTGEPTSTVRYHLKILEREDEVATSNIWGKVRVFPADVAEAAYPWLALEHEPAKAKLMGALEDRDTATSGELADLLECAPSTVSHHLAQLEEEDLIDRERNGQSVHVSATDRIEPARLASPPSVS